MRVAGTSAMVLLRGLVYGAVGVDRRQLLARIQVGEDDLERDTSVPADANR